MSEWRPQAILFDLDDTLSDHLACARAGLVDQQRRHPEVLGSRDLAELESIHSETLELTHSQMMAGELSMEEARLTRTQRFWSHFGVDLSDAQADAEQQQWREAYAAAHGVVRGTYELLDRLSSDGYRLGVITNNLEQEQHAKIAAQRAEERYRQSYQDCHTIVTQIVDFACKVAEYNQLTERFGHFELVAVFDDIYFWGVIENF